jgi:thioredoxin 1
MLRFRKVSKWNQVMIEVSNKNELIGQLKSNKKIIALFYASWCPFCRRFLSTFDKYSQKPNFALFIRVNMDDNDNPLWEEYDLEAVPSVIFFENGKVSKRLDCEMGAGLNEDKLNAWLQLL